MRPWLFVIVTVGQVLGSAALARDPFSVEAKLRSSGTGTVLAVSFSVPEHHHLYADKMKVEAVGGIEVVPLQIPLAVQKKDPVSAAAVGVYERDVTWTYAVQGSVTTDAAVRVKYQGCSETECFFPVTKTLFLATKGSGPPAGTPEPARSPGRLAGGSDPAPGFVVVARTTGYLGPAKFIQFLDDAETGRGNNQDRLRALLDRKGVWIWAAVVLIMLGGLGLNLTPCVLPMIPINIAIIGAGAQAGSRARGLALGATYGAGIALAYGGLGLFVVLTGAKFGVLNSSPVFNIVVALVFVLLSLAMFDVVTLDFSRFQGTAAPGARRGRYASAFVMGVVSALLAGACVAPVVVSVLLVATDLYRSSQTIGLVLPFLLGVGMALPWPFAGAGLSFLPKPGRWMERVKRGFGVLILAMAGWYGYLGFSLAHDRTGPHRAETADVQKQAVQERGWMTSLDEASARAQQEGKLLIVDFWASWCKNCMTMDETTFRHADVNRRLEPYVKAKYQAEDLSDPAVKAVLDRFGVVGLPTYVVLKPGSSRQERD